MIPLRKKQFTLLALCLGLFMAQLDTTVVNLALPRIAADLRADIAGLQWIIDAYNLTFGSLLLTGGTLGDLFGRKRVFLIGLGLFLLGSAVCALAPSLDMLIAGRVLQGLGAAVELPGTLSILSLTFPEPPERAGAMARWASVSGVALAVGPTAGALLLQEFDWQSLFLLNLPIGLVALLLGDVAIAESRDQAGRRFDPAGQLLAVTALASGIFAAIEGHGLGWTSPVILGSLLLSAAALTGFVLVERRVADPMVPPRLFTDRPFAAAIAIAAAMTFGMYGLLFVVSLYLQSLRGAAPLIAGLELLPMSIAFILVSPIAGRLLPRLGARWLMTLGMALMGAGNLLLAQAGTQTPIALVCSAFLLLGAGMGFNTGPVIGLAVARAPASRAGMAGGLANAARMVGATLGVAILGSVVAANQAAGAEGLLHGIHAALWYGGLVQLAGALVAAVLVRPETRRAPLAAGLGRRSA